MKEDRNELVISFLRGDRDFLHDRGLRDWLVFCRLLDAAGLLTRHVPLLLAFAPTPVANQLEQVVADHAGKLRERAEALAAFDDAASSFSLRFLVVKGMSASKMLRDDEFAFDSSDIDILVHPDDIPKADAVLHTAMCSTALANATTSFLVGDMLMHEYEAECLAAGVAVSDAVFLISAIDLLWSCLDLVGRNNLAAAITNVAGDDFSTPVAISYYRDETIPSYWTYNVEPWTGATMHGCIGARGTFRNLDQYWFGD